MDKTNHNHNGASVDASVRFVGRGQSPTLTLAHPVSRDRYKVSGRKASPPTLVLQAVVDACAPNIAILNDSGRIVLVNKAWRSFANQHYLMAERCGVGRDYLEVCKDAWGMSGESVVSFAKSIQRLLDGKETEFSQKHRWHSPKFPACPRWLMAQVSRLDLSGLGGGKQILVMHLDITEHQQAEDALRELGARLIGAQEEERKRVALELHDDLNQRMAILAIELEQFGQKLPKELRDLRARVRDLWTKTQEISSEIHRLAYQLHPSRLDHLSLTAAVEGLCDELRAHHDINIEFWHREVPATLPKEVTLCLFRIVQESLSNVIRHSRSREARVELEITGPQARLTVSDTGRGFEAASSQTRTGLGFISMQERVRRVGGEIAIHSEASRGTRVNVLIPLAGKTEEL